LACADHQLLSKLPHLNPSRVAQLEKDIDAMTSELPELKDFIMPGGTKAAATLHLARTVCRRAEREVIHYHAVSHSSSIEASQTPLTSVLPEETYNQIVILLNRLSDYLFVAARYINFKSSQPETKWQK